MGGGLENSVYFCLLKNSHLGEFGSLVRCKNRVKMGHNSLGRWVGVEDALDEQSQCKKIEVQIFDFGNFWNHFGATWSKIGHFVKFSGLTKVNSREINESFLDSRKLIPAKKFLIIYSRKLIPAKYFFLTHSRKLIPAKCKNFANFSARESFFPRKFLPLK